MTASRRWVRRAAWLGGAFVAWALAGVPASAEPQTKAPPGSAITLEGRYARLVLDATGRATGLFRKAGGANVCAPDPPPFAAVRKGGQVVATTAISQDGPRLTFEFAPAAAQAILRFEEKGGYWAFTVESLRGEGIEELTLGQMRLTLGKYVSDISGVVSDGSFGCALRALDPRVEFRLAGGPTPTFSVALTRLRGIEGARFALAAAPAGKLRAVLKDVVRNPGQLWSPLGGPFALDAEPNRGSYVFAFGLSEANVGQWVALCRKAGIAQVHLIGWEQTTGHYAPNKELFPTGLAGLKKVVAAIHAAGLRAGMHTLTGLIAPNDAYITPVPDRRLSTAVPFTLAAPISAADTSLLTVERPHDLDTLWAYGSRGNVLRIDDELIQYDSLSSEPPYGFTKIRRGAFGTRPQPHAQGAPVCSLGVYAGCFQPNPDSTLVDDIATNIASVYNGCGFDMIYMDGAEGTPGGWSGVAKMRAAIYSKVQRPPLVEASEWGYLSWPFHSRIGAWDYPNWGLKRFVDLHCTSNETVRQSALLPAQLGWWCLFGTNEDRYAELPDEVEYLCCKAAGLDMPMSFQGVGLGEPENQRLDEYLPMIGAYERLRLGRRLPPAVLAKLREPGKEFHLSSTGAGAATLSPVDVLAHKVTGQAEGNSWSVTNRFGAQPPRIRIQALHSAAPFQGSDWVTLTDFAGTPPRAEAGPGTTARAAYAGAAVPGSKDNYAGCELAASGTGWARAAVPFPAPRDLSKYGALGVWVLGDAKGEVLNLQLTNPVQYWPTYDEHYVTVDFAGWRYFELPFRERDAGRWGDYRWPYGDSYSVYRNPLIRGAVSALTLYLNNLPASGEARVLVSAVRALPLVKTRVTNPALTVGGTTLRFPVTLESGQYLEFDPPSDLRVYDERAKLISRTALPVALPQAQPGANAVRFSCDAPTRAAVTITLTGPPVWKGSVH